MMLKDCKALPASAVNPDTCCCIALCCASPLLKIASESSAPLDASFAKFNKFLPDAIRSCLEANICSALNASPFLLFIRSSTVKPRSSASFGKSLFCIVCLRALLISFASAFAMSSINFLISSVVSKFDKLIFCACFFFASFAPVLKNCGTSISTDFCCCNSFKDINS